jgi:hypothetical protein
MIIKGTLRTVNDDYSSSTFPASPNSIDFHLLLILPISVIVRPLFLPHNEAPPSETSSISEGGDGEQPLFISMPPSFNELSLQRQGIEKIIDASSNPLSTICLSLQRQQVFPIYLLILRIKPGCASWVKPCAAFEWEVFTEFGTWEAPVT